MQANRYAWVLVVVLTTVFGATGRLQGAESNAWGRLSLGARFSDAVQEAYTDVLVPVWQPEHTMLAVDLRGHFVEEEAQQASGGLLLRRLLPDQAVILGLNTFYDYRWTEYDNEFQQVGAGLEVLSRWADLRANYYYPLTDPRRGDAATMLDACMTCPDGALQAREEALEGYDVEVGGWLPIMSDWMPTALYAGYYDYSSDLGEDISGGRVRAEIWFSSYVSLDAVWYEDQDLYATDYFVGLQVHLPLNVWPGGRFMRQGRRSPSFRLLEPVQRDARIQTRTVAVPGSVDVVPQPGRVDRPDEPTPEEPEPTCFLDAEGEVVCE